MGHASSFVDLVVPSKGCVRGSLDDLRNLYHAFRVSDERAFSTPVGPVWHFRDFKGSAALDALRLRRPGVKLTPNTRVHACFAGLSMGDKWAPSIAQVSHENVLHQSGALRDEEHICLGFPLPRAPLGHYSGVCIDDKVSLQVFPQFVPVGASEEHFPARDLEACRQSDLAYGKVGLETHPKKVVRRAANCKVWGAQFTEDCLVSMDPTKLVSLCKVTAQLAHVGVASERLLSKVMGLWAFAFQFRRPLRFVHIDL